MILMHLHVIHDIMLYCNNLNNFCSTWKCMVSFINSRSTLMHYCIMPTECITIGPDRSDRGHSTKLINCAFKCRRGIGAVLQLGCLHNSPFVTVTYQFVICMSLFAFLLNTCLEWVKIKTTTKAPTRGNQLVVTNLW